MAEKIGSTKWVEDAEEFGKIGLCSYCRREPIHRKGPGFLGICKKCDAKLDAAMDKGAKND